MKFELNYVILYIVLINIVGFGMMALDKFKAQKGYWRTPEKSIFTVTLLGGGFGTIAGMYAFRHKTKKLKFTIGLPTILISEIALIIYLLYKGYLQMIFI